MDLEARKYSRPKRGEKMKLLEGKRLADDIITHLERKAEKPRIAVVLIGHDERSKVFVGLKEKALKKIGAEVQLVRKPFIISENKLCEIVDELNKSTNIDGILIQLPLPEHIDENKVLGRILPSKDVDGLTPENLGNLLLGNKTIVPCTVKAIMKLLEGIPLEGKHVVVISRSNLIGKPLAMTLLQENATVTICHSKTKNLAEHTRKADIIIAATGIPRLLKADMIKKDAVIIDAGYAVLKRRVTGDADFESVKDKASLITPVPGGVGPLTVAMVAQNLFEAKKLQKEGRGKFRVVWLSANQFGYEMLKEALKLPEIDIVAIITLSESATTVMYDAVEKERWYEFGVPVHRIERINEKTDLIYNLKPDLIVEAGWRQIISNEILNIPKYGTVGFHPTLLPRGRGPAPIINSILEGIKESGVTLFYLCDRVDAGDIVGQSMFTIQEDDYAEDVYAKVVEAGKVLVQKYLPLFAKGNAPRIPQDEASATYFQKRSLAQNEIDLEHEALETIERKIRALSKPYKGAWIKLDDRKLVIWKAELE